MVWAVFFDADACIEPNIPLICFQCEAVYCTSTSLFYIPQIARLLASYNISSSTILIWWSPSVFFTCCPFAKIQHRTKSALLYSTYAKPGSRSWSFHSRVQLPAWRWGQLNKDSISLFPDRQLRKYLQPYCNAAKWTLEKTGTSRSLRKLDRGSLCVVLIRQCTQLISFLCLLYGIL